MLAGFDLRHVGAGEIDRVEQHRREAEVLDRFGDDLAREREQQARGFDQHERRELVVGDVAQPEHAAVAQIDEKVRALVRRGLQFDAQDHFMDIVADAVDVEIELDVELGRGLPLENLRRARILDRQVLDILRQRIDLRGRVLIAIKRGFGIICLARHIVGLP